MLTVDTDICGGLNEKCLPYIMTRVFSVGPQLVALLGEAYEHLGVGVLLEEVNLCGRARRVYSLVLVSLRHTCSHNHKTWFLSFLLHLPDIMPSLSPVISETIRSNKLFLSQVAFAHDISSQQQKNN